MSKNIFGNLPVKLCEKLMPFQRDGIKYAIAKKGRCLIADEMGLGKTLQALSVAYFYKSEWPLLIIVPSSLRFCWVEEIEKWFPDTQPEDIFMVQTGNDASGIQGAKICIATYGLLSKSTSKVVQEALANQNFQVVIVDESHYIRNIKTVSCKVIVPLIRNSNRRILLSGTPSLSKPVELYPQLDAICPNKFGSWWTYTAHFCDAKIQHIGKLRKRNVDGASNLQELQKKLHDLVMIRRMKNDVLTELPPKQRQQILFQLKDSHLTKDIQKTFHELKSMMKREKCATDSIYEAATNEGVSGSTLSLIQKLYQLSGEAKIGPARDYVAMLCENKQLKFLVFAYHHSMMNGIQQTLYENDVKFIRIDGETPPADRQLYVQQFQSDTETRVAILSILAAGVGLTFTKASLVVFAEMYWTPGVLIQCEDRAHRIGQTGCVSVHYLVAKGTMDEWVWSAICKKTIITTTTLNGRRQALEADKGDKYQVDLLSTADAYTPPTDKTTTDFASIFASQQPKDQYSILDFMKSDRKRKKLGDSITSCKKQKTSKKDSAIEISDDEDEENKATGSEDSSYPLESHDIKSASLFKGRCGNKGNRTMSAMNSSREKVKVKLIGDADSSDEEFTSVKTKRKSRISSSDQSSSLNVSWGCTGCTFLNHPDLPFCEICNTPKSKKLGVNNSESPTCNLNLTDIRSELSKDNTFAETDTESKNCQTSASIIKDPFILDRIKDTRAVLDIVNESVCNKSNTKTKSNKMLDIMNNPLHVQNNSDDVINDKISICFDKFLKEKNSDGHSSDEKDSEGNCSLEMNYDNTKSHFSLKGRKSFYLDTYSPNTRLSIDESENSFSSSPQEDLYSDIDLTIHTDKSDDEIETKDIMYENNLENISLSNGDMSANKKYNESMCSESNSPVKGDDVENVANEMTDLFDDEWEEEVQSQGSADCDNLTSEVSTITDCESKQKDLSTMMQHKSFHYICSKYTARIYLYDENGDPFHMNFVPLDVEIGNQDNLPEVLWHPHNLRIVQKFVREWNSLTETKRRLIVKSSQMFVSPVNAYEQLRSGKVPNTQRHRSKEDIAFMSVSKASEIEGNVRLVKRRRDAEPSLVQATTSDGVPLCLHCSKPYTNHLLRKKTVTDSDSAWATRFCSQTCMDKYWVSGKTEDQQILLLAETLLYNFSNMAGQNGMKHLQTNAHYCREQVYNAEHGICQMCHFDAHSLYKQIRDTTNLHQRSEMIRNSKFDKLNPKQKEQMVRNPVAGQFWHVDHIRPVWEGGGQCDIDNLRTLCVNCHQKVTAQQATKRATVRKLGQATGMRDITAFFQPAVS